MKDFEILKQLVLAGSSSAEEALSFYHAAQERGLEFPLAWEEKVLEACLRKNPKRPDLQERLTKVYLAQGKKAESEFLGPPSLVASAQEAGEDHQAAAARYNLQSAYRDMEPDFHEIQARCRAYTMTSMERMYAMWQSVHHILNQGVPGAIVECGVWRGGSMMIAAHVLVQRGEANRDLYLFDTYEGLPRPDAEKDVDLWGNRAIDGWTPHARGSEQSDWARASQEEVEENLASTGYPRERLHLIKGMVEKTVPDQAPKNIALLRVDTDWESSTLHLLEHLYPRLQNIGILLLDDYGHFLGARRAADTYFQNIKKPVLKMRIDYTGRLILKS